MNINIIVLTSITFNQIVNNIYIYIYIHIHIYIIYTYICMYAINVKIINIL